MDIVATESPCAARRKSIIENSAYPACQVFRNIRSYRTHARAMIDGIRAKAIIPE